MYTHTHTHNTASLATQDRSPKAYNWGIIAQFSTSDRAQSNLEATEANKYKTVTPTVNIINNISCKIHILAYQNYKYTQKWSSQTSQCVVLTNCKGFYKVDHSLGASTIKESNPSVIFQCSSLLPSFKVIVWTFQNELQLLVSKIENMQCTSQQ